MMLRAGKDLLFDEPSQAFFHAPSAFAHISSLRSFACRKCPPPPSRGSFVAKDKKELKVRNLLRAALTSLSEPHAQLPWADLLRPLPGASQGTAGRKRARD
eukprot:192686-Hanusia_phi.AAC.2